jgi:hypothetical protein
MSFLTEKPFGIAYNFPLEFNPIATELWRRDIPIELIDPAKISVDPSQSEINYSLIFNDPGFPAGFSSPARAAGSLTFLSKHFETSNYRFSQGRIINNSTALEILSNRARQISLFASMGVKYPKTLLVNNAEVLVKRIPTLRFPLLIKTNSVYTAGGVTRFETAESLIDAILQDTLNFNDDLLIVQELLRPQGNQITRVDTVNGNFLSAYRIDTWKDPGLLEEFHLKYERYVPSDNVVTLVEHIVRTARIDVGSVEFFTDRKSNELYFYGITPFNYRRTHDEDGVILTQLGNYFEKRLHKLREFELAL